MIHTMPPRVHRVCQIMRIGCVAGALALPLVAASGVLTPTELIGVPYPEGSHPSLPWEILAGALLALPMVMVGLGLTRMVALFGDYARGSVFTPDNAGRVRQFGTYLFLGALMKPLAHTLAVLALTHGFPPGQRLLQITLGMGDATLLAIGGGMAVLGWVMGEANRLAIDLDSIV